MDEGRKRVLLIAASILAARKLAHWDGRPSPMLETTLSLPSYRQDLISLHHDACKHDASLLEWFNLLLEDKSFRFRERYLHRKEGDADNAAYWYSRAGKPVCRQPLDMEWQSIVKDLVR